ncbi:MAG: pyridoxal phosphate-dependent aminotransferase [Phycisphaerae bacterium]|nr:pyridoxal phosphate-dependent aminotransferase [Phycisphaerae bacterium]
MQVISDNIGQTLQHASWIRRMFEAGMELKQRYGEDQVCDFSLGNPDLAPVPEVGRALRTLADKVDRPMSLGYMPNAGLGTVREQLAEFLAREQQVPLTGQQVVVTCGAAGALNVLFRTILGPGEEVLCPAPFFAEYDSYVGNFGGRLVPVPSKPLTFDLDTAAMEAALTEETRAVLINSPNNPTGAVYDRASLESLAAILRRVSARYERPVFLVSDEPYRFLTYDNTAVPPVLPLYPYSVVVGSFSKSLSLAGERIGYMAVQPSMPERDQLMAGLILCNRILGFVNAPILGQRIVEAALGATVDVRTYRRRRDAMAGMLRDAGIEFTLPKGAFYFFPKVPGPMDDLQFCQLLLEERILGVPGRGFGLPGHFRLAYCMDEAVILRASQGFKRAAERARSAG